MEVFPLWKSSDTEAFGIINSYIRFHMKSPIKYFINEINGTQKKFTWHEKLAKTNIVL